MKKLQRIIEKQLASLDRKLEDIRNTQIEEDPKMWDADYYYDLAEKLKEALQLLEADEGLLENLEEWQSNQEEEEDD